MKPRSKSYDYHGLQVFYRLESRYRECTLARRTPGIALHPIPHLLYNLT